MARLKYKGNNKRSKRDIEEDGVDEKDNLDEEEEVENDSEDDEDKEPTRSRKTRGRAPPKTKVKTTKKSKSKGTRKSFLKIGKAKAAAMKKNEARAKQREQEFGKLWRFFINKKNLNEDYIITFVDGNLDENGELENPVYLEHNMIIAGKWKQFVSCQEDEPDPLQEGPPDERQEPYLAQVFTIIDRTGLPDDDGNAYPPRKKLLVAKTKTQKMLQKLASKRGGLAGCTFTVCRTSDTSANIGDLWDFDDKMDFDDVLNELIDEGVPKKEVEAMLEPADYDDELVYYTADELEKLGLVQRQSTISQKSANEDADDIDDDF